MDPVCNTQKGGSAVPGSQMRSNYRSSNALELIQPFDKHRVSRLFARSFLGCQRCIYVAVPVERGHFLSRMRLSPRPAFQRPCYERGCTKLNILTLGLRERPAASWLICPTLAWSMHPLPTAEGIRHQAFLITFTSHLGGMHRHPN